MLDLSLSKGIPMRLIPLLVGVGLMYFLDPSSGAAEG
jgi:hypothetical protein